MKYLYMNKYFPILIIFLCFSLAPIANAESVPSWIKNTAGWWSQNSISDGEFIDSISFLINNGIISLESNCNPIVDKNRNQIPDEIEKSLPQTLIENRDWSNCKMPEELSFHKFQNINFSNTDFSNTNLFLSLIHI